MTSTRILSIDGGGIRGVIPAMILSEIEKRSQKSIADLFDLVSGTSTGGILALGVNAPNADGRPKYSAENLVEMYETHGHDIFSRTLLRRLMSLDTVIDEKYAQDGLETVLKNYFGTMELKECILPTLIPCYEIERRKPWFFRSHRAINNPEYNFRCTQVARAASAAPTYFEPEKIEVENTYYSLVDGGIFANNPTMCAYVESMSVFPDTQKFVILSLGTGEHIRPIYYDDAKNWGLKGWAGHILDIVFDGVSDTVHYQIKQLTDTPNSPHHYLRIQCTLSDGTDRLDNADARNINALKHMAETLIENHSEALDRLIAELNISSKLVTTAAAKMADAS